MGGIQTIDVRLEPAHAGWRLDRALAAAVPTLSRERLKALIRSGAVEAATARRSATRRSRCAATKRFARRRSRARAGAQRAAGHPADDRVRGRASAGRRQAGRAGRPSGRRQSRRDAGQRAAPPLRRQRCRASAASRGRASSTASTRTRRACWSSPRPTSPTKGWPGSSPPIRSTGAISRSSPACRRPAEGTVDAPLARSAANRKKIAIVEGSRGKRAVTHWKRLEVAAGRGAGRMPARNRPDPPGPRPHGLDRPSAARRPGLRPRRKDARQAAEGTWISPPGAARGGAWLHPSGDEEQACRSQVPMPSDMQELFSALGV